MNIDEYQSNIKLIECITNESSNYYIITLLNEKYIKINKSLYDAINAIIHGRYIYSFNELNKNSMSREKYDKIIDFFNNNSIIIKKDDLEKESKKHISIKGFLIEIDLFKIDKLDKISFRLRWLLSKSMVLFMVVLNILFMLQIIKYNVNMKFTYYEKIIFYFSISLALVFHELGHIVACNKYNVKTGRFGIGTYFFFPRVYINMIDIAIKKNKIRAIIDLSGVYFQLIYNLILIFLYYIFEKNFLINIINANLTILIFNIIPILKFDGYWFIIDMLDVKDLNYKTIKSITLDVGRKIYIKVLIVLYYIIQLIFNALLILNLLKYVIFKINKWYDTIFYSQEDIFSFLDKSDIYFKSDFLFKMSIEIIYNIFIIVMLYKLIQTPLKKIISKTGIYLKYIYKK